MCFSALCRTQRTAVGVLHGLYPPGTGPRQEDGSPGLTQYHLEAVPVYSTPRKFDSLLRSYSIETCPNWDRFASTERQLHSADYQKLEKETAPIRREIASISGFAEVDLGMINSVRDSFNVMRLYKIPWPEGMTQSRLDHLERVRAFLVLPLFLNERNIARLYISFFLLFLLHDPAL